MIDYELYPHIVETVLDFAISDTLARRTKVEFALRQVSTRVASRVDAALFAHIEIDHFDARINIEGANHRPLPGFRLRRYTAKPRDIEDKDIDATPSPLRLLRYAKVVDFRASIDEDQGERLYPVLRECEVDVVRNIWDDGGGSFDEASCPLRCAKFVTYIPWDGQGVTTLDSELLAPGARRIAATFALPTDVNVHNGALMVEGEMEGCDEAIVRFVPEVGTSDSIKLAATSVATGGLGILHGFVEPMASRGGSLTFTLVGAEVFDQGLFGLSGKAFNAASLKSHIVDAICAQGVRQAEIEAAVKVQTFEERKKEIGKEAFDIET